MNRVVNRVFGRTIVTPGRSRSLWRRCSLLCLLSAIVLPIKAQAVNLAGIAHAAFRVSNLDASLSFYEKLGFEQAFAIADQTNSTEAFIKINNRQFIELYTRAATDQPLGLMHLCFDTADLRALHRAYISRGLDPTPVKKAAAGNLLFTLQGPGDSKIEFTQYLPGSKHYEDRGKHLGKDRVSHRLTGAALSFPDPLAAQRFYTEKLSFSTLRNGSRNTLELPGNSGEIQFLLAGKNSKAKLFFSVHGLRQTAEDLRNRGFIVHSERGVIAVADPDGNMIVFRPE